MMAKEHRHVALSWPEIQAISNVYAGPGRAFRMCVSIDGSAGGPLRPNITRSFYCRNGGKAWIRAGLSSKAPYGWHNSSRRLSKQFRSLPRRSHGMSSALSSSVRSASQMASRSGIIMLPRWSAHAENSASRRRSWRQSSGWKQITACRAAGIAYWNALTSLAFDYPKSARDSFGGNWSNICC